MTVNLSSATARPLRVLDLFCCEGIGADGYAQALGPGVEIVGFDIWPQPNYPYEFHQGDAMDALDDLDLASFDLIHASPPCQAHTAMSNRHRGQGGKADSHTDYIAAVRWALCFGTVPYVIENVVGAARHLREPVKLRGGMFGLGVDRPRLFEATFPISTPTHRKVTDPLGVYGKAPDGRRLFTRKDGSIQWAASSTEQAKAAMGIAPERVVSWRGVAESIPPAFTAHIAACWLESRREEAA